GVSLYLRASHHVPAARNNLRLLLASYVPSAALWLLSLALPPPWRYLAGATAMAIELATPVVGVRIFRRGGAVSASHLPERFGLFTLIVLGESVVAVASGTAGTNWRPSSVAGAMAGFVIAACLWWAYFAFLERAVVIRGVWSVHLYNFGHLPILISLTMVGVGIQFAIEGAGAQPLAAGARWALCGGVALYLLTTSAIYVTTLRSVRNLGLVVSLTVAAVALALGFGGGMIPSLALLGILVVMLVGLVGYKVLNLALTEGLEGAEPAGMPVESVGEPVGDFVVPR
ncbi:MAG: hypothetical protein AVDCRST_MAG88-1362, partial [uncultured Thermomicrobiales bacterium]